MMEEQRNTRRPIFAIIMSMAVLGTLLAYFLVSAPKGQSAPKAKKEMTAYEKVGLPAQRSKEEIAMRLKEFEAEEKRTADENKEFYTTPAGKIWKKYPMWSKQDCEKLAGGDIWIGMSVEMLKYSRGKPNSATPSNYGDGVHWQYCWTRYTPSCFYDNDGDGNIDAYN